MISDASRAILSDDGPIRVHMSPYTYVRTTVMASTLFDAADYRKLLKLSIPEMIQMLEESTYRREIDELATTEDGTQLVEHVMQRNFWRTVEKLRRISDDTLRFFIDIYVWRNDIQNVKTLLRAKRKNETALKVRNTLLPGTISKDEWLDLYTQPTIEGILDNLSLPFIDNPRKTYEELGLEGIETTMTQRYYQLTHQIALRIPDTEDRFRQFLLLEVDFMNILTVLKLKRRGLNAEEIVPFLINPYEDLPTSSVTIRHRARRKLFAKLAAAPDVNSVIELLENSRFAPAIRTGAVAYRANGSLLEMERETQAYLLRRAAMLSHQRPLQPDAVLSFLFAKVIETRNILVLVKGKELEVSPRFLEQELIIR